MRVETKEFKSPFYKHLSISEFHLCSSSTEGISNVISSFLMNLPWYLGFIWATLDLPLLRHLKTAYIVWSVLKQLICTEKLSDLVLMTSPIYEWVLELGSICSNSCFQNYSVRWTSWIYSFWNCSSKLFSLSNSILPRWEKRSNIWLCSCLETLEKAEFFETGIVNICWGIIRFYYYCYPFH